LQELCKKSLIQFFFKVTDYAVLAQLCVTLYNETLRSPATVQLLQKYDEASYHC